MSDAQPTTRRERRVTARKEQILHAAGRLFAERGFHRTTTKDIAEAADVSEGTIYNYFANKDELLLALMAHIVEEQQIATRLVQALPEDPREFLLTMLHWRRQFMDDTGQVLQAVTSEILVNPELRRRYYDEVVLPGVRVVEEHLRARVERGQIRALDPLLAARIVIALTNGLFLLETVGDPHIAARWNEISDLITTLLFDGALPKP
jgi:AcrR family transcriptional regulator